MTVIRSCVLRGQRHDELPADAYACPRCQLGLVRKLADVEVYLSIVSAVPIRVGDAGPLVSQFESTPPLRLEVVAMLDRRTELNGPGEDDVLDETVNIWADLYGWACILMEENPDAIPLGGGWPRYLRSWVSWIVRQPWVDEFAQDVTRVHAALRLACRDVPEGTKGHCISILPNGTECGADVFSTPDHDGVRCSSCRRLYTGLDLARLHVANRKTA